MVLLIHGTLNTLFCPIPLVLAIEVPVKNHNTLHQRLHNYTFNFSTVLGNQANKLLYMY